MKFKDSFIKKKEDTIIFAICYDITSDALKYYSNNYLKTDIYFSEITLNVGEIVNNKGENRIYEINKIKKDGQGGLTASEGQGHLNTSSTNSISQIQENSQEKIKKFVFLKMKLLQKQN